MSALVRNLPSEEGRKLGKELARLADAGEPACRLTAPAMLPRCGTCAFREGTVPNTLAATLMTAVKCAIEVEPFYCHERKDEQSEPIICMGWLFFMGPLPWHEPGNAPWPHVGVDKPAGA